MNVSNTTKILMLMWTKPYVELQLCLWWLVLASSLRYTAVWFCLAESTSPSAETTYSEVSISKTQPTTQPSGGWRVFLSRAETCISTSHRGFFYSSCFGLGISQKPTQRSSSVWNLSGSIIRKHWLFSMNMLLLVCDYLTVKSVLFSLQRNFNIYMGGVPYKEVAILLSHVFYISLEQTSSPMNGC